MTTSSTYTEEQRYHIKVFAAAYALFILFLSFWTYQSGQKIMSADGAYYMLAARDFLDNKGMYPNCVTPRQLRNKPEQEPPFEFRMLFNKPLFPVVEAGVFAIFGAGQWQAMGTCFSFYVLSGFFMFMYVLPRWGPVAAYSSAIALLSSREIMRLALTNQGDLPFTFFMMMATFQVFLGKRENRWLGGVFAAGAVLTRPNGILIAFVLSLVILLLEFLEKDTPAARIKRSLSFLAPVVFSNGYMFGFNYFNFGGMFSYYDLGGGEYSTSPLGLRTNHYWPEQYYPNNAPQKPVLLDRIPTIQVIVRLFEEEFRRMSNIWVSDPFRLVLFIPALLWVPVWVSHPAARWILLSGIAAMVMQAILARNVDKPFKDVIWILPFFCVAAGIMVRDLSARIAAIKEWPLKIALAALLGAALVSATVDPVIRHMRTIIAASERETGYREREWLLETSKIRDSIPEWSVVIGKGPMDFMFPWIHKVYGLQEPADFASLLASLKKLRTDEYYHAAQADADIFSPRSEECMYNAYPEASKYATLHIQNRFFCMWKLDAAAMRKDFAAEMDALPY